MCCAVKAARKNGAAVLMVMLLITPSVWDPTSCLDLLCEQLCSCYEVVAAVRWVADNTPGTERNGHKYQGSINFKSEPADVWACASPILLCLHKMLQLSFSLNVHQVMCKSGTDRWKSQRNPVDVSYPQLDVRPVRGGPGDRM
eukprot:366153-Chlamydomonas_euryale.AAC.2